MASRWAFNSCHGVCIPERHRYICQILTSCMQRIEILRSRCLEDSCGDQMHQEELLCLMMYKREGERHAA